MKLSFWGETHVGKVRKHNEDAFGLLPELGVFIVADGMGGHAAGEVASGIAVQTVKDVVSQYAETIKAFSEPDTNVEKKDIYNILEYAVQTACFEIYRRAQNEPEKRGMGTTVEVLLLTQGHAFIAHVGDSRVYLVRQGEVHQLTEDHSVVNELLKRGTFTREELENSPYGELKNALSRAVGVYESVEVDIIDLALLHGDAFLLCSDGLHSYLSAPNIEETFRLEEPEKIAHRFIEIANEGGGHDNITAVVVQYSEGEDLESALFKATEINLSMEVLQQVEIFRYLTYREVVKVHNLTELRSVPRSQVIVREGEEGHEFYIILKGKVRLQKNDTTIAVLKDRDHFGEMALVDKSPRSASAVAMEDTKLIVMRRRDFYELIKREHALAVKLLWNFVRVLTARLRSTTSELSEALSLQEKDTIDLSSAVTLLDDED